MTTPPPGLDPPAVIRRLRELDARSGGRRVAWSEVWREERARLDRLAHELVPGVRVIGDAFGNRWYVLDGTERPNETVLLGSHTDCVPDGGWLDGALGVHAGLEVLAAIGRGATAPRRTVALVDWADEEGVRFGRSLLGSSAACGDLSRAELAALRDADGTPAPEIVAAYGFEVDRLGGRAHELAAVACAVELHIEQGPILETSGREVAAVAGCLGVARSEYVIHGSSGHAGATPMALRSDPVRAAAEAVAAVSTQVERADGLATVGRVTTRPGIPTAVAAECSFTLDIRHYDGARLAELAVAAAETIVGAATAHGCEVAESGLLSIPPVDFDRRLVDRAVEITGGGAPLRSGPLHDSAALAAAGIPAVMIFAPSAGGISHTREEDTPDEALRVAIERFAALAVALISAD